MVLLLLAGRCYEAEIVPFCSSSDALSDGILFPPESKFQNIAENHGLLSMVSIKFLCTSITPH